MNYKLFLVVLLIWLLSANSYGAAFGSFDPRAMAMGGTGVASGTAADASYYNPALLATPLQYQSFTLVLPAVAVDVADPKDLRDALDNYNNADYENATDSSISTYNASSSTAGYISNANAIVSASQNLLDGLNTLANKAVSFNVDVGVIAAVPSESFGFAIAGVGRAVGGAVLNISGADQQLAQDYINVLSCVASLNSGTATTSDVTACNSKSSGAAVLDSSGQFINVNTSNVLTSTVNVRGALIKEFGFSMAHNFDTPIGSIAVGITPKTVKVDTFDYSESVSSNADINADTGRLSYSGANLDIGAAKTLNQNVKVGLVVKNLFSKSYKTVLGNTVKLEPQIRAGAAYQNSWVLLTGDLDVTSNKGTGFENDTQYAAIGAQFDALGFLQLRAGFRHNLKNSAGVDPNVVSAGFGLNLYALQIDLAVAKNSNVVNAGLQISSQW